MREAVVLVGHGGIPTDAPRALVTELRGLEAARRAAGHPDPSPREQDVERRLREWPRSADTDPYQAGLLSLAAALAPRLQPRPLVVAYNEFCAPSVGEAIDGLVARAFERIVVLTTMVTPGGSHAERDIPEQLRRARERHPRTNVVYAWPFDTTAVAALFAAQVERYLVT